MSMSRRRRLRRSRAGGERTGSVQTHPPRNLVHPPCRAPPTAQSAPAPSVPLRTIPAAVTCRRRSTPAASRRSCSPRLELLAHLPRAGDVVKGHADALHLAADQRADRAGAVAARGPSWLVLQCSGVRFLDGAVVGERPSLAGAMQCHAFMAAADSGERRLAVASQWQSQSNKNNPSANQRSWGPNVKCLGKNHSF